jgi:hypothetical protein
MTTKSKTEKTKSPPPSPLPIYSKKTAGFSASVRVFRLNVSAGPRKA